MKRITRLIGVISLVMIPVQVPVLGDSPRIRVRVRYQFEQERSGQAAEQILKQGVRYYEENQLFAAIQYLQEALQRYRELKHRLGEGQALSYLGLTYYFQSEYKTALTFHEQSLVIDRELKNRVDESVSLSNLGVTHHALGNYKTAIALHEQSLAIAQELKDRRGEGQSLGHLADSYYALGQYQKAIEFQEQNLTIRRDINDQKGVTIALSSLGDVYFALGNYPKAIALQKESLAIARVEKNVRAELSALNSLGVAYDAIGSYEQALQFHQSSLKIAREIHDLQEEGNTLGHIGGVHHSLGNYQLAIDFYQQSLALAVKVQDRRGEGLTRGSIGTAYAALSRYSEGLKFHQESLAIAQQLKDRHGEAMALSNLGVSFFQTDNLVAAANYLKQSIAVWESLRSPLNDANKISLADTQARTYQLLQKVLVLQNRADEALEVAEQGRARAFAELLATRSNATLNQQVMAKAPRLAEIRQIAKTQNATLVEYSLISQKELYIWVVQPNGKISFYQTKFANDKSLSELLQSTRSALKIAMQGHAESHTESHTESHAGNDLPDISQTQYLQDLYQTLIAPISPHLPRDPEASVIFLPQGDLFLLPFAALVDAQGRYLIQNHTLSIAPSIQTLQFIDDRSQMPQRQGSALVVGDPEMPTIDGHQLSRLPGAQEEALAIGKLLNTKPLVGKEATKTRVLNTIQTATIIHLATHGLLDSMEGEIPGVIALAPSAKDDGLLSASEIFDLKLQADLAVLSACDTGLGTITGDGVIGLSRSFMAAGVPSMVVSLWKVDDTATRHLMTNFYQSLHTQSKAKALRQAMLTTLKQFPNPQEWAAFTLVGAGDRIVLGHLHVPRTNY